MKFKVGDTVCVIKNNPSKGINEAGDIAIIKDVVSENGKVDYALQFNYEHIDMHDCEGKTEKNKGWYVSEDEIELEDKSKFINIKIEDFKILIDSIENKTEKVKEIIRQYLI